MPCVCTSISVLSLLCLRTDVRGAHGGYGAPSPSFRLASSFIHCSFPLPPPPHMLFAWDSTFQLAVVYCCPFLCFCFVFTRSSSIARRMSCRSLFMVPLLRLVFDLFSTLLFVPHHHRRHYFRSPRDSGGTDWLAVAVCRTPLFVLFCFVFGWSHKSVAIAVSHQCMLSPIPNNPPGCPVHLSLPPFLS